MYIPENCFPYDATFAEAEDFCRSMALRLCRADEINAGNCCSKGCWFDRHYTWFGNTSIPQGNFQNQNCETTYVKRLKQHKTYRLDSKMP